MAQSMFYETTGAGAKYQFSQDTETFAGWEEFAGAQAHSDDFSTVAKRDLQRPEGISFGRGSTENPDRAEAWMYLDARSDDADTDGNADKLKGEYEIVVLNSANRVVGIIDRGRLDEVRRGDPTGDIGTYGVPFKRRWLSQGSSAVIGGKGHAIALRLKLDKASDGSAQSDKFVLDNSTLAAMGHKGTRLN